MPGNRNLNKSQSKINRFARALTISRLTAILFILISSLLRGASGANGVVVGGTRAITPFRNNLKVALRNGGINGLISSISLSTAAALVPGPDQDQMMALVCKHNMFGIRTDSYSDCLKEVASVQKLQIQLFADTQQFLAASLKSSTQKIAIEVESQVAVKTAQAAQAINTAVEERVRSGRIEAQRTRNNLQKQINNAKRNKQKNNAEQQQTLAELKAAKQAFEENQKKAQELRNKLYGLAGGIITIIASPGKVFESFTTFIPVFMLLVVILTGLAGLSSLLFFVPGTSKLFSILKFRKAGNETELKKACEELKRQLVEAQATSESKINALTAQFLLNNNKRIVNITNLTQQRNSLSRQLNNAKRNLLAGANKNKTIVNLTRERNNLTRRLNIAMPTTVKKNIVKITYP